MQTETYSGLVDVRNHGESEDVVFLDDEDSGSVLRDRPLTLLLEDIKGKRVSVRYWVSDRPCTPDDAMAQFVGQLDGVADVSWCVAYSEITGYLWTTQDLNIGGHDLLEEIESHKGKWLILQIDIHE